MFFLSLHSLMYSVMYLYQYGLIGIYFTLGLSVLVNSGSCNKTSQTGWLVNKRNILLTRAEVESEIRGPAWLGEGPLQNFSLWPHMEEGSRELWGVCVSFIRANPIHEGGALKTCSVSRGPTLEPSRGLEGL